MTVQMSKEVYEKEVTQIAVEIEELSNRLLQAKGYDVEDITPGVQYLITASVFTDIAKVIQRRAEERQNGR